MNFFIFELSNNLTIFIKAYWISGYISQMITHIKSLKIQENRSSDQYRDTVITQIKCAKVA